MFDFFSNLGKRKLIALVIFVFILIAFPLILIQVQKQQEIRQRAEGKEEFLYLDLDPHVKQISKGESFITSVFFANDLGEDRRDISAIDVIITYSNEVLALNSFEPNVESSGLTTVVNDTSIPGKIHYVGINTSPSRLINGFYFGRLSFKGKVEGVGAVGFSNIVVTSIGETQPLAINTADNRQGTFTVGEPTPISSITSVSPTTSPLVPMLVISPTISSACQAPQIISCGNYPNSGIVPSWLPIDGVTRYRLEWCYGDANFSESDFKNRLCGFIADEITSVHIGLPRGANNPEYKVRVRSEASNFCPQQPGVWSEIKPCSIIIPTPIPPTPTPVSLQLISDKSTYFSGDTIKVSFKVDSKAGDVALSYSTSNEISTDKIYPRLFKHCDPKKQCSDSFSFQVPEGNTLKIIVKAYTDPENQIADAVISLPIRHFSANVNPSSGSPGTLFAINAKTEINLEVKATIVGPGISNENVILYDDGNHGDGSGKDGVYGYIFHSPDSQTGVYTTNFTVDNREMSDINISVATNYFENACIPFTNIDGPIGEKINLVVVSDNYSENELDRFQSQVLSRHVNFIFSKEPYLSNKNKFNVWFIKKPSSIDCSYGKWDCVPAVEEIVSKICSLADKIIVLDKHNFGGYGSVGGKTAVVNAASVLGSEGATLHEFGHTIGNLVDEYKASPTRPSDTSKANCDIFACSKWCSGTSSFEEPQCHKIGNEQECKNRNYNGTSCIWDANEKACDFPYFSNINFGQSCMSDAVCLYGCAQSGGYRSSNYGIMGDTNTNKVREYNTVSKTQIQKMIDLLWKQKNN